MPETSFRLRVRYGKLAPLRHLSHLEVVRACERSVRRAALPYSVTRGFSPKMKVAFGPALPVGTAGLRECYDLWLSTYVEAGEAHRRLAAASPPGLAPDRAAYVAESLPSLSAALVIARYEVTVAMDPAMGPVRLGEALRDVLAEGELAVEHKGREKVFELAAALPEEPSTSSADGYVVVRVTTRMGPEGSLRPESLVTRALELSTLPGAVFRVTRVELLAETAEGWVRPLE